MDKERKIKGGTIGKFDFQRYNSMGVKPYYFKDIKDGGCEFVEVTPKNVSDVERKWVFLLKPEELERINKLVGTTNELVEAQKKKIALLKELIPAILIDKIMSDPL